MKRQDDDMAFLLKYENVAWYDKGSVRILDRRVYPYKKEFVTCKKHTEVAKAIKDMVTQSGGPYTAAAMGMALAGYECKNKTKSEQISFLEEAAYLLSHARPTTSAKMQVITNTSLELAKKSLEEGKCPIDSMFNYAYSSLEERYKSYKDVAYHLVKHFPENGTVMTMCFAETIIGTMLLECKKRNKTPRFICPETRPYLQGSRLTASCISDMDFDVRVICDNMPAYIMGRENVDVFTSAADVITMDGYVVNKVGTFQIALAAQYHQIPYFVTGSPNKSHPDIKSVNIEERDHTQVTNIFGTSVVKKKVNAFYPAFDIVPPKFCNGVVTQKGLYSNFELEKYYEE
ncbi:MAG: s-methyl-5-thioribose-1-phosphate isomerase [Lachnospirales bacterium]